MAKLGRFSFRYKLSMWVSCVGVLGCIFSSVHAEGQLTEVNKSELEPFLKQFCYKCHGEKRQRGDVRLDTINWSITDNVSAQHWQDILDVLNSGEMPPEDEKQPNERLFTNILGILTKDLDTARNRLADTGGVNTIRRINKREYENNIKHLFGLNIDTALIPLDLRSEDHFDTASSEQYFDAPLLEQYIRLGTEIALEGLQWSGQPYREIETVKHEGENHRRKDGKLNSLPLAKSGYYLFAGYLASDTFGVAHGGDPRASYKFSIKAGHLDDKAPARHSLIVKDPSGIFELINVHGTIENPSVESFMHPRRTLGAYRKHEISIEETYPIGITNRGRWTKYYLKEIGANEGEPNVWIDWVEVEGPYYSSKSNVFGNLISKDGADLGSEKKARELIKSFAEEAFRKVSPSRKYVDGLYEYFLSRREEGESYKVAMSETIGLILASPGFLYLEEGQYSNSAHLSGRAFATRLSHFLWSSPPDEELYKLGISNQLFKAAVLKDQVERMLRDPRADSFFDGFMSQWALLERLQDASIHWKKVIPYTSGTRWSSYREPIEFFKVLVENNLSVENLIDSNFVVVNPHLADFYGIKTTEKYNGFKAIPIPEDSPRGGFITQSAFLAIGSSGERTSPVIRGTLILEKLLNNPPPPPPPNVPELGSASEKPLSNRELVEMHREQKVCASCHDKIDPIGFGLENFDAIGLWRTEEVLDGETFAVDTKATLVSGVKFEGLNELQKLLNSRKHMLARNMVESLLAYGMGRNVEFSDKEQIDKLMEVVTTSEFKMEEMIFHVTNSRPFRTK